MRTKYVLVEWPESQKFMDHDECYSCPAIDGAMFVPEKIYNLSNKKS